MHAFDRETVEDGRLEVLRATLEEAEEEKRLNEASLKDGTDAMDSMMKALKATKQRLAAKDAEFGKLKEELRIAQSEELLATDRRRKIIRDKNVAVERIEDRKRTRDKTFREKETMEARVLDFSEKASLVSPRVPIQDGETASSLDKKLDRLHRDIERYNQELVSNCRVSVIQLTLDVTGWELPETRSLRKHRERHRPTKKP